jgi:crotonobetainyl-CoA:carnitine CoA-transferase CaiB-like acyl-CoA transferase
MYMSHMWPCCFSLSPLHFQARPGAAVTDVITGLNTLSAVLAALLAQRTRRDARRIAELDATVAALAAGAAPGAAAEAGALAAAAAAGAQGCRIRDGFVIDGARLETSLIEAQVAALANIAQVYLASGVVSQRRGTAHGSIVPYQCFPITANAAAANATTDAAAPTASAAAAAPAAVASEPAAPPRFIAVGALNNKQFQLLVGPAGLDLPAVAADPRFATNPARVRHQAALLPLLTARLGELDPGATMAALAAAGVPVAPVLTVGETLNHPQVLQREMVQFVDYPQARSSHAGVGTGTTVGGSTGGDSGEAAQRTPLLALCGPAVKMFRTTAPVDDAASDATDLAETRLDLRARLPPPFLAQHTEEVLAEVLRLSATEIEVLKNDHIVAQHPRWTQAAGASDKPSK